VGFVTARANSSSWPERWVAIVCEPCREAAQVDELEAMKSHVELAAGHLLQALKCAAKLAESQPTAPNTGSPKLPGWEDVSNEIRRHRTYTHPGAELVDLGIAKIVYDFIARQLRADA